ncbi:MAG: AIPR family protein [Alphaproteobacteria bacterium]|nr:AIPR family protein [Alphaproteobacteria bacterium]MBU4039734.1 AIPR family protein [Alphaproteobacteria bacterium]MBU4137405.1 AIPR family protein [Alphaproteobacteria bacterium]
MSTDTRSRTPETVRISYQALRNLTAPEEKESGIQTYFANIPVAEIDKLATGHNLRDYIAEHNARKRNQVHRAIRKTIDEEPVRFINRNSGITICCSDIEVDEKDRTVVLRDASLINGAQTQGEIRGFLRELAEAEDGDGRVPDFHIRAEINVDPDEASVIETAIARNTATSVKSISQAGARGILKDLEVAFQEKIGRPITTSETDDDPNAIDTKVVLQICRLLMPTSLSPSASEAETLKAYKNKEKCLSDFAEWHGARGTDPKARARYDFTIQIAPIAWLQFQRLNNADAWNGHRLHETTKHGGRAVRRDERKKVNWVAPGILFPMVKALSAFVSKDEDDRWTISAPSLYREDELVSRAVKQFRSHELDPYVMGRSVGAYEALATYTETIMQVLAINNAK